MAPDSCVCKNYGAVFSAQFVYLALSFVAVVFFFWLVFLLV